MVSTLTSKLTHYESKLFYDEMFHANLNVRKHYANVYRVLSRMQSHELMEQQERLQQRMMEEGITFTLYTPGQLSPLERTIPFDHVPRIIPADEWRELEKGLKQRMKALNAFIKDMYHNQNIVKAGIIPRSMIVNNVYFRPEMVGMKVPGDVYVTTAGIDMIRDEKGDYYVLEDNLRTPSGFSYLFKSRTLMIQQFPELFQSTSVADVEHSLNYFLSALRSLAPAGKKDPVIALLTPGSYNSAYYEHTFLAQQMGIHLVEGQDLVYKDHKIYLRDLSGLKQVDVIYRRLDDDYLDPIAYNPHSLLGVPGLMNAYRAGNITIANAPGTGVADDKAIYAYVPDMIRFYLQEEPQLKNVPTYILSRKEDREYALANLEKLVVKETSLSGGYGMLIGPVATPEEIAQFDQAIRANPSRYIAQSTMKLSTAPVVMDGKLQPRHIDLRAFVLCGADGEAHVIPGGLTRVALREGSLVVNSSQGGGIKDTWVSKDEWGIF